MAKLLVSGVRATTTMTGTGSYGVTPGTPLVSVANWRQFAELADGDQTLITAIAADGTFETLWATKSGGSAPILARTEIKAQSNGSKNPVDWDPGTPLTIYTSLAGEEAVALSVPNRWLAHQNMGDYRLQFGDGTGYIFAPVASGTLYTVVGGALATIVTPRTTRIVYSDDGAAAGPYFQLQRITNSPTEGDVIGAIQWLGRNPSGADVIYAQFQSMIWTNATGNHDGQFQIDVAKDGNLQTMILARSSNFGSEIFINPFDGQGDVIINKGVQGFSLNGFEFYNSEFFCTNTNAGQINCNRRGSDGVHIGFFRDDLIQGYIATTNGTTSLVGATLSHQSNWAFPFEGDEDDLLGTVVCSTPDMLADGAARHPLVRLSDQPGDPEVYGVVSGVSEMTLPDGSTMRHLLIEDTGAGRIKAVGPIRPGDLLETSTIPGVARAQGDDLRRASTIGKARQPVPSGETRLIACALGS
jgi:hypothetical protein